MPLSAEAREATRVRTRARWAAMTSEERQASIDRVQAGRRAKVAERQAVTAAAPAATPQSVPVMAGASDTDPNTRQYDAKSAQAAIDAVVLAAQTPDEFDPKATYVVMRSALGLKKGPQGTLRDPLFYGDIVNAEILAAPQVFSPGDKNIIVQEATDGVEDLRRFWDKFDIELPTHPGAIEARRLRLEANAAVPAETAAPKRRGAKAADDPGRLADIRLHVVGNGGAVYGFASGELVG